MSRKVQQLTIEKKVKLTPELAEQMRVEFQKNIHLYTNEQNQASESLLVRRALIFYLSAI